LEINEVRLAHHFKEKYKEETKMIHFTDIDSMGTISGGTIHSLAGEMALPRSERKNLGEFCLTTMPGSPHSNGMTYYNPFTEKYEAYYFMSGINCPAVRRTNSLLGMAYGQGFVYSEGKHAGNYLVAVLISGFIYTFFGILMYFPPARWLLKKVVPQGSGPSRETTFKGRVKAALYGESVSGKRAMVDISAKRDPGYGLTSIMVAESAICLASDSEKLAGQNCIPLAKGGVLTAASAMGMVLAKRLQQTEMTLELKEL
jgi:short subunit dehydrogenase-like uncharacterized protein